MKTLQLIEENARKIYGITASDEIKQILEDSFGKERLAPHPNINEPVEVAGIMWGGYLTPSENCDAPVAFNEETGLHYFDQKTSAPLHAFEQGLRMPPANSINSFTIALLGAMRRSATSSTRSLPTKRLTTSCGWFIAASMISMTRSSTT